MKSGLTTAQQKSNENQTGSRGSKPTSSPNSPNTSGFGGLGNLSNLAANLGGDGDGGSGFDIGSLMNNPAFMNMAQQMMQSGALGDILNNPNVAEM